MHATIPLTELLDHLLSRKLAKGETDALVNLAIEQARKYIHWLIWHRGYHIGPSGLSVDDLAYDLVAELVSELDGEMLGRLRSAVGELTAAGDETYDLESAFIAVVNRNVRFNIARVFMDLNPVQARLLRALRRYAASSPDIHRIDSIGGFWYARSEEPSLHLPPAPQDYLRSGITSLQGDGNPVRAVLLSCLSRLEGQNSWRHAVLEHDVIELTMTHLKMHHASLERDQEMPAESSDTHAAGAALLHAVEDARIWVHERYVQSGKLSSFEADAMLESILRYIDDLQKNDVLGHVSYLRQTMPGLTHQRYRESYRNIYEYILRSIFTNARQRLQ